jgi:hypothetical protein
MILRIVLLVAALGFDARGAEAPSEAERAAFEQANRDFAAATADSEWDAVIASFESLRERGYVGAALLYDLGNAYARAGEPGRAIAAYLEALRYAPRDPQLRANLAQLRAGAGIATPPAPRLADRLLFWQDWLSYPEKRTAFLALLGLAVLLAVTARSGVKLARFPARGAYLLAALAALSFAVDAWRIEGMEHGVITRSVEARKGDAGSYAAAFTAPLAAGEQVEIRERRGEWLRVALRDGLEGWVPADAAATY